MTTNESTQNKDSRRVEQVLVEKSITGAMPAFFKVLGDSRLHPVLFYNHPHLEEIHFTDGSVSQVKATKQKPEYEKRVGPVPESDMDIVQRALNPVEHVDSQIDEAIRAQMIAATEELESAVEMTEPAERPFMQATEVPILRPYSDATNLRENPYSGDELKQDMKPL